MSITHITDHYDLAVARLPEQFKDKPRYLGWLKTYCDKIQAIEDVAWDVFVDRLIQNSPTGDLLAKLGALVGQANLTGDDAEYLLFIKARILANRSNGQRNDLIRLTQALWPVDAPPVVWLFDFPPATVLVAPQSAVEADPYISADQFLAIAVGGGIALSYLWSSAAGSGTVTPGSIHASGFIAGPPTTMPDLVSTQFPGSVHEGGFSAGPPPTVPSGSILAGVIGV